MRIRTNEELEQINASLATYNENQWDFLGVIEQKAENYEYFNDMRDVSFDKPIKKVGNTIKTVLVTSVGVAAIAVIAIFLLIKGGVIGFKNQEYRDLQNASNVNMQDSVQVIQGEKASTDERLAINNQLSNYLTILQQQSGYSSLDNITKDSHFNNTYTDFTNQIQSSFDLNDCYARSLKAFGSYIRLKSVDEVIIEPNSGEYYAYIQVYYPAEIDIKDYVNANRYSYTKYFTTAESLDTANVMRYMLENLTVAKFTSKQTKYIQIRLVKQDNQFIIVDDSVFTELAIQGYSYCIDEIIKVLRNVN